MTIAELYEIYRQHPLICTDTRKIESGCIFFALKGPSFNANTFAGEALANGAAYAVIDEAQHRVNDRCLLVEDVLTTLQQLSLHHRNTLNIPVIAIAGSNGKTTTKELMASVLSQKLKVWATPGNLNNHIGLPLTLLRLNAAHEVAVIEMGANHIGENAMLCELCRPDLGIVTNNGKDHLEGFGSIEGVAQSNNELYEYLHAHGGLAFVNANDAWLMKMASDVKKVTYAANTNERTSNADVAALASALRPGIAFDLGKGVHVQSVLSGDYNFDNIMAAVAFGRHFGLSDEQIKAGIESYQPSNNRSQVIRKSSNTLYMDAYNANPSSMEASLRNFAAMPFDNKVAIIGDMFELGRYAEEEHANMIRVCRSLDLDEVLLVGEEFSRQGAAPPFHSFHSTADVISYLRQHPMKDRNIFMKGSRGMKLESIAEVID